MKTKIIIAGIGGVGGYFGGMLAKHFYQHEDIEIVFFARGNHLHEIKKNGLKIIHGEKEFIARPSLATDNSSEIGIADLIIIATKNYDLIDIVEQLKPCVDANTVILPLLNGVDSTEQIQKILPDNLILNGCVYIVARLKQAGIIENTGNIERLYFGTKNINETRLSRFENLFKEAGINAELTENIEGIIWEKYIFISPVATTTSYFDSSIGELLIDEEKLKILEALMDEVINLARAKKVPLPIDIKTITLKKMKNLPFNATSSMHSDFKSKKLMNELESLTGYVVNEGGKFHVEIPVYESIYNKLKK